MQGGQSVQTSRQPHIGARSQVQLGWDSAGLGCFVWGLPPPAPPGQGRGGRALGNLLGDQPAQPSYRGTCRTQPTRPDHILANELALGLLVEATVTSERWGSDHWPIQALVQLQHQPAAPAAACQGTPLPRRRWLSSARDGYAQALSHQLGLAGPGASAARLLAAVSTAAAQVGMPARIVTRGRAPRKFSQPFYDAECRAAKQQWEAAAAADKRHLGNRYHSLVRRKARAYRQAKLRSLLDSKCLQQRSFWRMLRRPDSRLPDSLQNVQAWQGYMQHTARAELPALSGALPGVAYPAQQQSQAAGLNGPITLEEVRAALPGLHNGRALGSLGLPAELLRYAQQRPQPRQPQPQHVLAPALERVLYHMFSTGHVPPAINVGLVTPVYKRGDKQLPASYRPITVMEPLLRLYSSILNQRLVQYTEEHSLRAASQAGFRPGLSVQHQLFALQHLSERQSGIGQPCFVCFMDLKSAYDLVPRALLWQVLARLGVHGAMLTAIQGLYSTATVAISVQGRAGPPLPSETGVRQGCPLSPTLFGLLADGLHRFLQATVCSAGIHVSSGMSVTDLAYADDFALISSTAVGLQQLINAADQWCSLVGMRLSPEKTVIMELTGRGSSFPWRQGLGPTLQHVQQARYLGVHFETGRGFRPTFQRLERRMWASYSLLRKQYGRLDSGHSLWLLLQLYDICVTPAGSFAAELWGVYQHTPAARRGRARLEVVRLKHIRQLAGLRKSVALPIIWEELSLQPFADLCLLKAAAFWNKVASSNGLHKQLALEAIRLALDTGADNWARGLHCELVSLGYQHHATYARRLHHSSQSG